MFKFVLFLAIATSFAISDTITSNTGEVYTGFVTQSIEQEPTYIVSKEKGRFEADLSQYKIEYNQDGRENKVIILKIDTEVHSEIETVAFEKAMVEESNKGPIAIIIEIDTPGGRVDLAKKICGAIMKTSNCKVYAYIYGGDNGGAYSAGAAISMACDEIYMAPGSCIGAATAIMTTNTGITDMKEAFGDTVGEKFGSAWRNYMASVAQQSGKPSSLAKAMAEKDIEILEIERGGKKIYIESSRKMQDDKILRIFCPKGTLLTLTSQDAIQCGMAKDICPTRPYILNKISTSSPDVIESKCIEEAREELDKVTKRFKMLESNIKKEIVQINARYQQKRLYRGDALKSLKSLSRNAEFLINLKKKYPDVPVSEEELEMMKSDVDGLIAAMQ